MKRPRFKRAQIKARGISNERERNRRLKKTAFQDVGGGTSGLRAMLFMTLFGFSSLSNAATFNWDGKAYIPLGLQQQSETVLRLHENISNFWGEQSSALFINKVDDRTLSLSPASPNVEQRMFLRGVSGKIYIAKVSTKLKYSPIVEITDVSDKVSPQPEIGAPLTASTMMLKMMRNELPVGFSRAKSNRQILDGKEFTIAAEEVWSSPTMTGIITTFTRTAEAGTSVEIKPDQIEVYIPELGQLRIIGMDKWMLDDSLPQTHGYLVFTKS